MWTIWYGSENKKHVYITCLQTQQFWSVYFRGGGSIQTPISKNLIDDGLGFYVSKT